MASTRAPSSRAASVSAREEESESDKESIPASEVGSLFGDDKAEEEQKSDPDPEPEHDLRPHIEFLKPAAKEGEDRMALLTSPKDNLEILLPAGKEWKLSTVTTADGDQETMLVCTSDPSIKKRYVYQAMKSSKAQPIGTALSEMESALKLKPAPTEHLSTRKTTKQPPSQASKAEAKDIAKEKKPEVSLESELKDIERDSKVRGEPDKKKPKTGDVDSRDKDGDKGKEKSDGDKAKEKSAEDKAKEKSHVDKAQGKSGDGSSGDKKKEKSGDGGDKAKAKSSDLSSKDKATGGNSMDES